MPFDHTDIVRLDAGLAERKPPIWLIDGILEAKTFSALVAKAGSYKSFIALDMAQSIAHGLDWHGHKTVRGSVVYCVGEGLQGLYGRMLGWHNHYAKNPKGVDLFLLKGAKGLHETVTAKALYESIKYHVKDNHPQLIIIDTLSRYSTGIDENSNSDMARLIETITNELSVPFNCSVMLIHHTGKIGDTGRGASSLNGALDAEWKLTSEGLKATMANSKSKDHAAPEPLVFDMLTVPIEDGKPETTLVPILREEFAALEPLTPDQILRGKDKAKPTSAQRLYAHLADMHANGSKITEFSATDLQAAIGSTNMTRIWRDTMRNIADEMPGTAIKADDLKEFLAALEVMFDRPMPTF